MPLRRFIDGDENDPRQDDETRGRIREIQAGLVAWQAGVDRRYHRVARLLTFVVVATLLAIAVGYALLQGQRWDALRDGCVRTNQQAEASVGLLKELGVKPSTTLLAMVRYPHTPPLAHREGSKVVEGTAPGYEGPVTCDEFADQLVGWPRL